MSRKKWMIALGIFLALTLVKMVSPTASGVLRDRLGPAIDHDFDYRAAFHAVGSGLSQAETWVVSKLGWETDDAILVSGEDTYVPAATPLEPESLESLYEARLAGVRRGLWPQTAPVALSGAEADTPPALVVDEPVGGEAEQPDCVAAFLERQASFADQPRPDNVSYDYTPLTLDWTAPCSGNAPEGFGYRLHPVQGEVKFHYGTDIGIAEGSDIVSFADGTVLAVGDDPDGYGLYAIVGHADGWRTLYAHCSELLIPAGNWVAKGQVIAKSGSTGMVTGPHLHFELMHNEIYQNPEYYLGETAV